MPLQRRLPKFGFKNINRVEYKAINLYTLQALAEKSQQSVITEETFVAFGLASKNDKIKILGQGQLSAKLEVSAHAFSKSAVAAIEAQQGKASVVK